MSETVHVIANDLPFSSGEANPLKALVSSLAFSSMDWGEARDTAWIYGIVCGWDDDGADEEGAMPEVAAKFGWTDEQVARLRALHAEFWAMLHTGTENGHMSAVDAPTPVASRDQLARVLDPDIFDESIPRLKHQAAVIQIAARQHMAFQGADRLLAAGVFRDEAEVKAEAWDDGHRIGWVHHQDGNHGNDYWDDSTSNPYRAKP